jgi:sugar O-acyltransferase (sialic acid O-acetyltransferase NeuD family)
MASTRASPNSTSLQAVHHFVLSELVIIGAGGFGRETVALVEAINASSPSWHLLGFLDDDCALHNRQILKHPVLGPVDWIEKRPTAYFAIALGSPAARREIAGRMEQVGAQPATLIHPTVHIHHSTTVGRGSILCAGCQLTVDIQVAPYTICNLNCTVGHDTRIHDFATLHPGVHLSGNSAVGTEAELGTGCVVLPGRSVGDRVTIGAGAVVTRDVPSDCTAVGIPARPR